MKGVIIQSNSKLQIIDNFAFSNSAIGQISIPSEVSIIGLGAFSNCYNLKIFEISENSKLQSFDIKMLNGINCIIMMPAKLSEFFKINKI